MGFFKKLLKKINTGFIYVVDLETLQNYLKKELRFSLDNNLEASADLNIYLNTEKHHIQIWNYSASKLKEDRAKGVIIYYDDFEFTSIDDLINTKLNYLPTYFKIELTLCDDVELNKYKENHPELREADY